MRKIIQYSIVFVFLLYGTAFSSRMEHVREKVDIDDAHNLVITCELAAGEFKITPEDITYAAIIEISYNPRRVSYIVDSRIRGDKCFLELESEHRKKSNIDSDDNIWDIILSTQYTTSIDMDISACDAEFDFGGIPMKELVLNIGAVSGMIDFSEPNPIRLDEIDIDAGASSLDMHSIGNANFEYFNFSGGVGYFDLDFRGEYEGESIIDIDIGLGSADIVLPRSVPIRVETEGSNWLSSVDFHNDDLDEVEDDVYETPDFESADTRIILKLEVGLGSVDLYWRR